MKWSGAWNSWLGWSQGSGDWGKDNKLESYFPYMKQYSKLKIYGTIRISVIIYFYIVYVESNKLSSINIRLRLNTLSFDKLKRPTKLQTT